MKNYLLYLVLLFTIKSSAQKIPIYLSDSLTVISKADYEKPLKNSEYIVSIFLDSVETKVRVNRISVGNLSAEEFHLVKQYFIKESQTVFSDNDVIVINYYPGKDRCNSTGDRQFVKKKYQTYNSQISKMEDVKQFFVYKELIGSEKYGNLNWIPDSNKVIESTFFKIHYPCGSYVIIKNDGSYYSYKGEYDISTIIKNLLKIETSGNSKLAQTPNL